jgi:hypothetical protein
MEGETIWTGPDWLTDRIDPEVKTHRRAVRKFTAPVRPTARDREARSVPLRQTRDLLGRGETSEHRCTFAQVRCAVAYAHTCR